jgi:hypothetical protein
VNVSLQPGDVFNPFRMFNGLYIPEALARCHWISAGAKLAWGRLARYAGEDGRCYPTVKTLAAEIGLGERQGQKYVAELERARLIRRVRRFDQRAQKSNEFEFLWHEMFAQGVNDRSGEGVNDKSLRGVNDRSPKESHIEENENRLRLPGPISKKPHGTSILQTAGCKQYPRLREALADYMQEPGEERIYASDRHVVDVMDAAEGASEQEVIECLRYFLDERGLRPGTQNAPRRFSWFPTAVGDYFHQKRKRQEAADPMALCVRSGPHRADLRGF